MPPRLSVLGAGLLVAATALPAQEPTASQQQPTFRESIQSVRVDLYATRDGKPVTDLRRDEIQLFEDGTPQTIQSFEQIAVAPHPTTTPDSLTPEQSQHLLTDPRARLFVIVVPGRGASSVGTQIAQMRIPFIRHINGLLGPDDLVAVMTPDTPVSALAFQRRLPAVASTWFDEPPEDPRHALWDICYPSYVPGSPNAEMKARHRELMAFESLEKLIARLGGIREERKHVLMLSEGFRLYQKNPNLGAAVTDGGRTQEAPVGGTSKIGDSTGSMISTRQCEADLADLGSLDHNDRLEEIAALARRNNVAFYPIAPTGLTKGPIRRGFGGTQRYRTPSERLSALRRLAEDTGGLPLGNTTDIENHLQKIMTATSAYYLIGYSPTNTTVDGRYRRISVKVSRSNIEVRARQGYVALPPLESRALPLIDTRRPVAPVEVAMRPLTVARSSALNFRSATWTRSDSSGSPATSMWIVAELDAPLREGRSSTTTAELTLRPARNGQAITRQASLAPGDSTIVFELRESEGPLPPGDYNLQVQITNTDGEPVGEFGRVAVPDTPSPLGEAVLLRRGVATTQRYVRTADPRFVRTDRLRMELPTDDPGIATAVLHDRRGTALSVPLQVSDRRDESGAFRWVVVDVPLTSLAPADYAVEVAQAGVSRMTAFRLAP